MTSKAATLESLRQLEKELSLVRSEMVACDEIKERKKFEQKEKHLISQIADTKKIQIKL